jgi:DNA topoisomerase-2
VHFVLKIPKLQEIMEKEGGIEKKFKLSTSLSTNNYVLFNYRGQIQRYSGAEQILAEFFDLRKEMYDRRKAYMLSKLMKDCETLANKVRFILAVIADEIRINKVKRRLIVQNLKAMGFKTTSELNEILNEKRRVTVVEQTQD